MFLYLNPVATGNSASIYHSNTSQSKNNPSKFRAHVELKTLFTYSQLLSVTGFVRVV